MQSYNSFEVAQTQITAAAKLLNLDKATLDLLLWPQREFKFTLPVKMDNGETSIFHGYSIQHNFARGPAKGGIRFHPDETIDTIRALAGWMTWKTAVVDIPLGRREGRRRLRSAENVRERTRKHCPGLRARPMAAHRHRSRCAGARCLYESANHGVDDG